MKKCCSWSFLLFQGSGEEEATYSDKLTDLDHMRKWLNDKANPLVREITFDNGEELTEEGLPFLLMFYKPGDSESIQKFKNAVERELLHERRKKFFYLFDPLVQHGMVGLS